MTSPSVALITLNWNGYDDTVDCLRSLAEIEYDGPWQVYLVDNGSRNDEARRLADEYPWARHLPQAENRGFAGGCNVGMRAALAAEFDYVLLINNDTVVEPDLLRVLVSAAESLPDAGVVAPQMAYGEGDVLWACGSQLSLMAGSMVMGESGRAPLAAARPALEVESVPGACMLVRSNLVRLCGLLDVEYFAYWEDVDWCHRFRKLGLSNYVALGCVIRHKKSASTGMAGSRQFSPLTAYYVARNAFLCARKNLVGWRYAAFLLAQFVTRAPYTLLRRTGGRSRAAYLMGVRDGFRGVGGPAPVEIS